MLALLSFGIFWRALGQVVRVLPAHLPVASKSRQ